MTSRETSIDLICRSSRLVALNTPLFAFILFWGIVNEGKHGKEDKDKHNKEEHRK
jgi:hypothetical protein